jgi:hypothetical protein
LNLTGDLLGLNIIRSSYNTTFQKELQYLNGKRMTFTFLDTLEMERGKSKCQVGLKLSFER